MFHFAVSFDSDISSWNTSLVEDMEQMMAGTVMWNHDISDWDVSRVTELREMFRGAMAFSQNLCAWGAVLPPMASATLAFDQTNCPDTDDPDLTSDPPGPFCFACASSDPDNGGSTPSSPASNPPTPSPPTPSPSIPTIITPEGLGSGAHSPEYSIFKVVACALMSLLI